jgi:hypothetical protein
MASSRMRQRISRFAFTAAPAVAALWASAAWASRGPGVVQGTASSFTQQAVAMIVWGTSALVVGLGLIGAVRKRPN